MTAADYEELGMVPPLDTIIREPLRRPALDPLPEPDDYPDEYSYKVALARWMGVPRCDECGDETGECAC